MITAMTELRCIFRGCPENADLENSFLDFPEFVDDMPANVNQRFGRTPPLCADHLAMTSAININAGLPAQRRDASLSRLRVRAKVDRERVRITEVWVEAVEPA